MRKLLISLALWGGLATTVLADVTGNLQGNGNVAFNPPAGSMSGHLYGNGDFYVLGAPVFSIDSPTNGQCLTYSTSVTAWINSACGGGGGGTVTSVSVVTANGLSGTVATATTTPAITLVPTFTGVTYSTGGGLQAAIAANFPTLNQSTSGNAATATALAANPTDCSANQYSNAIDASGNLTCAQVAAGQVTGLAASATTDTTNAGNISAGTLLAARLPAFTGDCTTPGGSGVLTCGSAIARTGTDINTSNQVTATHLASALPVLQGGLGTVSGTAKGVLFYPTTTSTGTSSKFTWTDSTATMNLSSSNALDATIVGGNSANKITMGFNDGTHLFAGAIDMVLDHGDIFVTGSNNPILLIQNTVANPAGFNGFQFANEIGDGLNFGNQPSTATSCSYLAGSVYPLTPATGCSLVDSGSQNTNPLPLVLGVDGHTVAVFQNLQGLFAVGTTPKQWAGWSISGTVVTLTLGDSVTAGSITNIVGGSAANTRANGVQIATVLTGTTGSIGGGALLAGACTSGTVAVTGSTTAMTVGVTPVTYPGDGTDWKGYVSSAGTVTAKVCGLVAVTPTATAYNVRVTP